jgi:protein-disulfide isomerase
VATRGERLGTAANVAVIAAAAFLLLRPTGPVGARVAEWNRGRALKAFIDDHWATIQIGSRLDTMSAPIEIVEFSDYECAFCRRQHLSLMAIINDRQLGGIAFRHLPLPSLHARADGAARSAICAEAQGHFLAMHNQLMKSEAWMVDSNWVREAEAAGVPNLAAFGKCRSSPETTARIAADAEMAAKLGIRGTPSFIAKGTRYPGLIHDTTYVRLATRSTAAVRTP